MSASAGTLAIGVRKMRTQQSYKLSPLFTAMHRVRYSAIWPALVFLLYPAIGAAEQRWRNQFAQFERQDAIELQQDVVLFVGSSSIARWTALRQDFNALPLLRRGLGGAKIGDIARHFERLIAPYQPRIVVLFAGTNDITPSNAGTPRSVLATIKALYDRLRALPRPARLIYIAITPTPARWSVWPRARRANQLIAAWAARQPHAWFAATETLFIDNTGRPKSEYFVGDGLHLNRAGYRLWRQTLQPLLTRLYHRGR